MVIDTAVPIDMLLNEPDGRAGLAHLVDAGVIGFVAQGHPVEEIERLASGHNRAALADLQRHVKAGPGDAALDVSRIHQAIHRAGDALHGVLLDANDRIKQRADIENK